MWHSAETSCIKRVNWENTCRRSSYGPSGKFDVSETRHSSSSRTYRHAMLLGSTLSQENCDLQVNSSLLDKRSYNEVDTKLCATRGGNLKGYILLYYYTYPFDSLEKRLSGQHQVTNDMAPRIPEPAGYRYESSRLRFPWARVYPL
jgi:hypothetical protein